MQQYENRLLFKLELKGQYVARVNRKLHARDAIEVLSFDGQ
jgi:hypothetical protein